MFDYLVVQFYLGDKCIQIFHLGWYIVGYTVEILFSTTRQRSRKTMISDRILDDIPPQMNIVIPILIYFLTINMKNALFITKCERHERRIIIMTLIVH